MVTQLIGKIDGQDVVFNLIDESKGLWETAVPLDLDGVYVVDLNAYDDAGNQSYFATVLFSINSENLHFTFTFLKYSLQRCDVFYKLLSIEHDYALNTCYSMMFCRVDRGYNLEVQASGYCLERGHGCE